jgi:CHAT domain
MATREIVVSVRSDGVVEARRDDDAQPDNGRIALTGLDVDLIRMFERWLSERDRVWRRDEITVIGRLLHRVILDGVVGDFVQQTLVDLDPDDRLRLQLAFPADGAGHLPAVPWEFLYAPDRAGRPGFFLATDPRLILSRYIPLESGRRVLRPEDSPLRMLVVVAQPDDPNLGEVVADPVLAEIEGLAAAGLPIVTQTVQDATIDRLEEALSAGRPHVLHFMGHGEYDANQEAGQIALLDEAGGARWVSDRLLVEIMQHARAMPRLVVLHSCDGGRVDYRANFAGMAPQLLRNGVQCVVAMQYAVTNGVAIDFSKAFYRHLSKGLPVDEAVQEGRWRITGPGARADDPRLLGVPLIYLYSRDAILSPATGG